NSRAIEVHESAQGTGGACKGVAEQESIWAGARCPMTTAISEDDGETWKYNKNIYLREDVPEEKPEFSSPAILQQSDGTIHITFTFLRQFIKHVVITENAVKNKVRGG